MAEEVALITVYNAAGELLLGKRNDNGKYTVPGGHLEEGEDPHLGAMRELWEETGLHPTSLSFLMRHTTPRGLVLHVFSAYVAGDPQPHGNNDPDQEVTKWEWIDVNGGLKAKYFEHLNGPPTAAEGNVLMQVFDMKKSEALAKRESALHDLTAVAAGSGGFHDPGTADTIRLQAGTDSPMFRLTTVPVASLQTMGSVPSMVQAYTEHLRSGGSLPPVVVGHDGAVLDGNHRVEAHRAAGISHVPAYVLDGAEGLQKAEGEVGRMLAHPEVNERLMALKLSSVTPAHLRAAVLDPEPSVHQAAIDHRKFGDSEGAHLMEAQAGTDGQPPLAQQLAFLARPDKVREEHLALLANASGSSPSRGAILQALIGHPKADAALFRKLYLDPNTPVAQRLEILAQHRAPADVLQHALSIGLLAPAAVALACAAVVHPNLPAEAVDRLVRSAVERPQAHVQEIAQHALANRASTPDLQDLLILQAKLKSEPHVLALVSSLLQGPSANANLIQRGIDELPPAVAVDAVGSKVPGAFQPEHMDALLASTRGDAASLDKLMRHPGFGPQHLQGMMKSERLVKMIEPRHFKPLGSAVTPEGKHLVDHTPDLTAHPSALGPEVEAYRNQVIKSPKLVGPQHESLGGVTKKRVFSVQVPGHELPTKMMVKPYHEKIISGVKTWMKHPHQGWSEMTNQSLFHAAGIGHLHQKVHVVEHNMGFGHEKEPALVVHLQPDHTEAYEYGGRHYDNPTVESGMALRKVAMMDFLANAQDRHEGNLLVNDKTQEPLAIDNGRNFQYMTPHRNARRNPTGEDSFGSYVADSSGISRLEELFDDSRLDHKHPNRYHAMLMDALNRYAPVFEWWGGVGGKVRQAFHERLAQIKDPEVREHLKRNFDARADFLDERAKFGLENYGTDWHRDGVPVYKPGELTEDEQADPDIVRAHLERTQAKAAAQKEARRQKQKERNAYQEWLGAMPTFPAHLGDLPQAKREKLLAWTQYAKDYENWNKKRPRAVV